MSTTMTEMTEMTAGAAPAEVATARPATRRKRRVGLSEGQQGLAARYLPLARSLARPLKKSWPRQVEEFDSAALTALVEAAQSFDPGRGVKFATFARFRIVGALRDVQRKLHALGYQRDMPNARTYRFVPGMEERSMLMLTTPDAPAHELVDSVEEVEHWLSQLPARHATACREIYLKDRTQNQVATMFGCAKSRVSCLHAEAILMLRESADVQAAAVDSGLDVCRN